MFMRKKDDDLVVCAWHDTKRLSLLSTIDNNPTLEKNVRSSEVHQYNIRSAAKQSYYIPKVRTNYGKFNIRFQAPMIWNAINEQVKTGSLSKFKLCLKDLYLSLY